MDLKDKVDNLPDLEGLRTLVGDEGFKKFLEMKGRIEVLDDEDKTKPDTRNGSIIRKAKKMMRKMVVKATKRANEYNEYVMEAQRLAFLKQLECDKGSKWLKLTTFNARMLTVSQGNRTLNKAHLLRELFACEIMNIQESFTLDGLPGYVAHHGLRRFRPGVSLDRRI